MPQHSRKKAYAVLVFGIACLAWSAIFVKWANVPGAPAAFYRLLIAASAIVPWRAMKGGSMPGRRTLALAMIGGVLFAIDLALYNTAVLMGSATTSTLMTNNAPLLVGLGTWFLFKQKPSKTFWIGLAVAMVGTAIVAGGNALKSLEAGWGDLLALLSAVFYAGYLLVTRRVRASVDTLTLTSLSFSASAASLLAFSLAAGLPLSGYPPESWLALLGLGAVVQRGGYLAVSYSLGHLPAPIASVLLLAQAPLTAVLAALFFGERFSPAQVAGGVLVLAGVFVVTREE